MPLLVFVGPEDDEDEAEVEGLSPSPFLVDDSSRISTIFSPIRHNFDATLALERARKGRSSKSHDRSGNWHDWLPQKQDYRA